MREAEKTIKCDLLDSQETLNSVQYVNPDIVIHLAGQASVPISWKKPKETFEINVLAAVNLLEAVRTVNPSTRIVLVGSSDEYGQLGDKGVNVHEDILLNPQTPYAVSKMAQEQMAGIYVRAYGMNICMTRSFNHCGAGQREGFLFPDFASGIAKVENGIEKYMKVGNLSSRRDFTHVKDVVRAYRLLAEKGLPGEIYNVGSGITYSAQEILDKMLSKAHCAIVTKQDPERMRPSETPVICCNRSKLTRDTGWQPQIEIDEIINDVLFEWREKLS